MSIKELEFVCEIDADVSNYLFCDQTQLERLLGHLLSNAIKFTEKGSVNLHIYRNTDYADEDAAEQIIIFDVIDTGVGIPENKKELIFKLFQQGDGAFNRRFGGLGVRRRAHRVGR